MTARAKLLPTYLPTLHVPALLGCRWDSFIKAKGENIQAANVYKRQHGYLDGDGTGRETEAEHSHEREESSQQSWLLHWTLCLDRSERSFDAMQYHDTPTTNAVLSPRVVFKTSPAFVLNTATSYCTCFPRPWLYSGADGSPKMRAGRSDHLRTEICSVGELT